MNINDVNTDSVVIPKNVWEEIFKKQHKLAAKYSDIEGMGTLLQTTDVNVNTLVGQKWIKDFAWRVTEELAEAYEAKEIFITYQSEDKTIALQAAEHFKEELIDALHFLVELTIIAGHANYNPHKKLDVLQMNPWRIVYSLGLMCNTLKNKAWKQTQMLTDMSLFTKYLNDTWTYMYDLLRQEIGDDKDIYLYYFKKNEVNRFRQRSKY